MTAKKKARVGEDEGGGDGRERCGYRLRPHLGQCLVSITV